MKRVLVSIVLFFIISPIVTNAEVKVVEGTSVCEYKPIKGGNEVYQVQMDVESGGLVKSTETYFIYGNNYFLVINYYVAGTNVLNFYYEAFGGKSAQSYIHEDGSGCPDYLYLVDNGNGGHVALMSNDTKDDINSTMIRESFIKVDYGVEVGEDKGDVTLTDDIKKLKYTGTILNQSKEFLLIINKTQNTFSISPGNFRTNLTYDSIKNLTSKLFVCFEGDINNQSYRIHASLEDVCALENTPEGSCNLNIYDTCAYFYSTESDIDLITEGCSVFARYYSLENLEKLRTFCSNILKNSQYSSNKNSCVSLCLYRIKELYKNYQTTGPCGFSERLVLWIANIVRWVKYIVPVAVIVLGILDFIKAIGADKEDVMKKSQQRFIKRLIAAALIFIIPFIIEFVLNKMGFTSNGCGIINL